jgi:redox-sensitive bicupin YhaK (pirin superfamily)
MSGNSTDGGLEVVIVPRSRDLGDGFEVRRALPSIERRTVGPFVFLDQMGPADFPAGGGLDVRPHPHIGLATVTYLLEGEILHRDSLGTVQPIRPGEVNWMTAGRGIVHSERTAPERRRGGERLFGLQAWVALPLEHEETAPDFRHIGEEALPSWSEGGCRVRLIAGTFGGERSPVPALSPMVYADAALDAGARLAVPPEHEERALYIAEGSIELAGSRHEAGRLLVLRSGSTVELSAPSGARLLLLGGAPLDGRRHLWWNFVASSPERIERAKADWKEGRFPPVPGETEFIPLPESPPPPVRYP